MGSDLLYRLESLLQRDCVSGGGNETSVTIGEFGIFDLGVERHSFGNPGYGSEA